MRMYRFILPAILLVSPGLAAAEDGFYAGVGAGFSDIEGKLDKLGMLPVTGDSILNQDFDDNTFTWKAFAGYGFLDYFGLEVAYIDFGDAESDACFTESPPAGFQCEDRVWKTEVDLTGWEFSFMGIAPFSERWQAFAKAGVIVWDADMTSIDQVAAPPGRPVTASSSAGIVNKSDDGTDLAVGAGLNYKATDQILVRGEFQWFDMGDFDTAWITTLSAIYRF